MLELGSSEGMQLPLTTDAEGRFFAGGLNANRGPDHAAVYLTIKRADHTVHVVDLLARTGHEHTIRLPEFHSLRGTVLLGGRPVDHVDVALFERGEVERELARGASGEGGSSFDEEEASSATGRFVLDGLEAGPRWIVVGPHGRVDFMDEAPTAGVDAWQVEVPAHGPLTYELKEPAETPVQVRHAGGLARDARVRVFPQGAAAVPSAPVLRSAFCDDQGAAMVQGLGRGATYDVVADLPDGRRVTGSLRGGDPCELVLPGGPLPTTPAEVRFEAIGPDGRAVNLRPKLQVYAVSDPSRPLLWWREEGGLSLLGEDETESDGRVPAVGDAWVVVGGWDARAVRRVTLAPGAVVDLGRIELKRLPAVDLELVFDPGAVNLYELVLEWRDPVTGAPSEWSDFKVLAPGKVHHVRLPAGSLTVGGYWRAGPAAPKQALTPVTLQVAPGGDQPLVIRLP